MRIKAIILLLSMIFALLAVVPFASAQPYGAGVYSEVVPYGNLTSLSIATDPSTSIPITPTAGGTLATGNNTVTVTSTDVNGFQLYIRANPNTDLTSNTSTIPASANSTPASLINNTWGYNTNASASYKGITTTDALIGSLSTPTSSGFATTVTYGVKVDLSKASGSYSTAVLYTAVPQTL